MHLRYNGKKKLTISGGGIVVYWDWTEYNNNKEKKEAIVLDGGERGGGLGAKYDGRGGMWWGRERGLGKVGSLSRRRATLFGALCAPLLALVPDSSDPNASTHQHIANANQISQEQNVVVVTNVSALVVGDATVPAIPEHSTKPCREQVQENRNEWIPRMHVHHPTLGHHSFRSSWLWWDDANSGR